MGLVGTRDCGMVSAAPVLASTCGPCAFPMLPLDSASVTTPQTPTLKAARTALFTHLALAVGLAFFLGHVALLYRASVSHTGGSFCYPLDDAFIHMAIGRNLARHGVFGVTPQAFTAASSSVLWPLALAAVDAVVGDRLLTPLVLNLLAGVLLIAYLARQPVEAAPRSSSLSRTLWIAAVVGLTPLPTIAFLGMEHTAHILVSVVFVAEAARWLARDRGQGPQRVAVLAALATSLRYEALFLAGIVAFFALLRRRFGAAAWLLGASAAPVVLFGLYSITHGGVFLPNSVLLKGNRIHLHGLSDATRFLGGDFMDRICSESHMLAVLLGSAAVGLLAIRRYGLFSPHAMRITISVLAAVAHIQFASLSWFFRYEAYTITLLVANVGLCLMDAGPTFFLSASAGGRERAAVITAGLVVAILAGGPLVRRALFAAELTPTASRNIYDQQVQTARFLRRSFHGEPAAVNDIGAVSYFGDGPMVDLGGLATLEAARAKHFEMFRPMPAADVARLTESSPVAVVYDAWVPDKPTTWTLLGRWNILSCASCAAPVVSIYAVHPADIPRVMAALVDYTPYLPEDVHAEGLFLDVPVTPPDEPDYVLSEGDTMLLSVSGLEHEDFVATVLPDGSLLLPYAAPVVARGLPIADLPRLMTESFGRSEAPEAHNNLGVPRVRLLEPRWNRIDVVGNVYRYGERWWPETMTLAALLARSGGPTAKADAGALPYAYRRVGPSYVRTSLSPDEALQALDVVVFP